MRKSVGLIAAGATLLGVGVGWAAGAASGDTSPTATTAQRSISTVDARTDPGFSGQLVAYDSCAGLLDALHARADAIVGPYGLVYQNQYLGYGPMLDEKSSAASLAPSVPNYAAAPAAGGATDSGTLSHSDTNTQVKGVDEPDITKTDGRYMVSLDGQLLHIIDVRTAKLRATIALPQPGSELLLAGNDVVVLTGENPGSVTYPVASGVTGAEYGPAQIYPNNASSSTTDATVVDISNPDAPRVAHRWSFNASEVAARVVNGTIRLVLSSPPPQETWTQPRDGSDTEKARATKVNQEIVNATPLDAWIPTWTGDDGQTHPLSACDAVATPAKPVSLSMVTVVSLDPGANQPGAGTSVLGAGSIAYAEGQHLFVSDGGSYPPNLDSGPYYSTGPGDATIHLLEFDISDPAQARYLASGSVPGQLHDSYALSEYQDNLRVTTTTTNSAGSTSTSVVVLARRGDALTQIGSVGGLGAGEKVYAVRYAGDRGYVVTFQQIDPLHVIDLSDPAKPVLRGTLSMPGYSSLLLPLSGDRLLGLGREISSGAPTCPPNATCPIEVEPGGLQLSLFDVSDAAHPKLLDRHVLSDTYATAVNDPHAVTLSPDGNLVILPSTSGPLAISISATNLSTTTGAFTTPYSVQDQRTVIAGERLFELGDRGVAVRTLPGLKQTGWIAF